MDKEDGHIVSALVVEDEPDYATLISEILQGDGYSVATASDGIEALDSVRTQRPDVITLDIQMPRKGGVEFYRELKSDPEFREIPVVVVTGLTFDNKDMETFIRAFLDVKHLPMPDAYLEKPVDHENLLRVIHDALRSQVSQ
jgi:CheY-like chemotaxis protein